MMIVLGPILLIPPVAVLWMISLTVLMIGIILLNRR
jgi:hypothetical protein